MMDMEAAMEVTETMEAAMEAMTTQDTEDMADTVVSYSTVLKHFMGNVTWVQG